MTRVHHAYCVFAATFSLAALGACSPDPPPRLIPKIYAPKYMEVTDCRWESVLFRCHIKNNATYMLHFKHAKVYDNDDLSQAVVLETLVLNDVMPNETIDQTFSSLRDGAGRYIMIY